MLLAGSTDFQPIPSTAERRQAAILLLIDIDGDIPHDILLLKNTQRLS
jgi:hypothetical protein